MVENKREKRKGRPPRNEEDGALESRSFRLGRRERFALRLLSRQTGVEPNVLIDRLIREEADRVLAGGSELGKHWLALYDPEDSIATLRLLSIPRYRPDEEDEKIRAFVNAHAVFFYSDAEQLVPHGERCAVLWPNRTTIKRYAQAWFKTRERDVHGVAKDMAAALKAAGASVPPGRGKW